MVFSLFPKTIYKTRSSISGEIKVVDWLFERTLSVQGIIQSGGIVKSIWKKTLKKIGNWKLEIGNCLILGLGGGTVVHLIKSKWPKAKITAIEIDPEIIDIGRRFFNLNKYKNLKILNFDAFVWIDSCYHDLNHDNKKYDLIIVDLYLGNKFPTEAENEKFIENIKKLLTKNGVAIFNRLRTDKTQSFEKKLNGIFSSVSKVKTPSNLLFLARS